MTNHSSVAASGLLLLWSLLLPVRSSFGAGSAQEDLLAAAKNGDAKKVRSAIQRGADPNALGPDGWAALHVAAIRGHDKAVKALLESKADPNLIDKNYDTPLRNAAYTGKVAVMRDLIKAGAKINARDGYDKTPLMVAVSAWQPKAVDVLLEAKADVNAVAEDDLIGNTTALIFALMSYHGDPGKAERMIKALLKAGADPNTRDKEGKTPLMYGANAGPRAVRLLLDYKADPNAKDHTGKSAIDYAQFQRDEGIRNKIIRLLKESRSSKTQ